MPPYAGDRKDRVYDQAIADVPRRDGRIFLMTSVSRRVKCGVAPDVGHGPRSCALGSLWGDEMLVLTFPLSDEEAEILTSVIQT